MSDSEPVGGASRAQFAKRLKLSAIVSIAAGVVCIWVPIAIGLIAMILVGFGLLAAGCLSFVTAWRIPSGVTGRTRYLVESVVIGLVGALILSTPMFGSAVLTWLLAVPAFVLGASRVVAALELRPRTGWTSLLVAGVLMTLLGVALFAGWPFSGAYVTGTALGLVLIIDGVLRIRVAGLLDHAD